MEDRNSFKNGIKDNFSIISNNIVNCPELTCGAKGVLCYLCSKPNNWQFFMGDIQKHFKDNIKRYVKELSDKKILIRTRRCLGQSKGFCWDWEIDYEALSLLCRFTIVENHYDSENTQYNNIESNSNTKSISNTEVIYNTPVDSKLSTTPTEFDEFWELYPRQRRGNKQKALRAYLRVIKEKRSTPEQLLIAVGKYAKSDEVKRGFAKGCEAWLNDDRFNTNYDTKAQRYLTKQQQQEEMFKKLLSDDNTEKNEVYDINIERG